MNSFYKLIVVTIMLIGSLFQTTLEEKSTLANKDCFLLNGSSIISSPLSEEEDQNSILILSEEKIEEDAKSETSIKKISNLHLYRVLISYLLQYEDKQDKNLQNPKLLVEFTPLKLYDYYCDWQMDIC